MKAKATRTSKGNIKLTLVLSEKDAQYVELALLHSDPSDDGGADDPWDAVADALRDVGVTIYNTDHLRRS